MYSVLFFVSASRHFFLNKILLHLQFLSLNSYRVWFLKQNSFKITMSQKKSRSVRQKPPKNREREKKQYTRGICLTLLNRFQNIYGAKTK